MGVTTASLTRTVEFSAAHRYYRPDWTEEENRAAFGACANEPGHGHSYRCGVTVRGPISPERSMIVDLSELDAVLREEIVDRLDHQHINHAVPEFSYGRRIPTAEALAVYLWEQIEPRLPPGVTLRRVRVEEDARLHADYEGPNQE